LTAIDNLPAIGGKNTARIARKTSEVHIMRGGGSNPLGSDQVYSENSNRIRKEKVNISFLFVSDSV
jgi:hypothetical protein